jgi:hypothetical protein
MSESTYESCPYKTRESSFYWKNSLVELPVYEIDPVISSKFKVGKRTRIATAGSCFAQHLSKHIKGLGYNYYVPEPAPRIISTEIAQRYNYGVFSCRYGNIYTSKQLVQTFDRAFGHLDYEGFWEEGNRFYDPLRPFINPNGFSSLEELNADRNYHLSKVKEMFEKLNVFIFTLGLTESWIENETGMVHPVCPGCGVGRFSSEKYKFYNESVFDVISNLQSFNRKLMQINPKAKIILTVSPVPLIATMEKAHVLTANTYSKSTLRVAAHEMDKEHDHIAYFPSFEIITGSFNRGAYFSSDLRTVTPSGIQHVMSVFTKHYTNGGITTDGDNENKSEAEPTQDATDIICEEELMLK